MYSAHEWNCVQWLSVVLQIEMLIACLQSPLNTFSMALYMGPFRFVVYSTVAEHNDSRRYLFGANGCSLWAVAIVPSGSSVTNTSGGTA